MFSSRQLPAQRTAGFPYKAVSGFSLIELAVVVAIIGILAAVAIPTFLGQRNGALDREAQANLRNILSATQTAAANNNYFESYPGADSAGLAAVIFQTDPMVDSIAGPSTAPDVISVYRYSSDTAILAALSDSGTCWYVRAEILDMNYFDPSVDATPGVCDATVLTAAEIALIDKDHFASQ